MIPIHPVEYYIVTYDVISPVLLTLRVSETPPRRALEAAKY